jgi:hypothetical protein
MTGMRRVEMHEVVGKRNGNNIYLFPSKRILMEMFRMF